MIQRIFLLCISLGVWFDSYSQNLPVSFQSFNELLRRNQVVGSDSTEHSFFYRPVYLNESFVNDDVGKLRPILNSSLTKFGKNDKGSINILPLFFNSSYTPKRPFGRERGAFVYNRGLQTGVGMGVRLDYGNVSVQLYPEFRYSQNLAFDEYPENAPSSFFVFRRRDILGVDEPARQNTRSTTQFLPGNSNIMVNFGSFQAGLSTENIWWGPGKNNALLISDNAPGFLNMTIRTSKPAKTFIGNFEGQYFAGKLDGSDLPYYSDAQSQDIYGEKDNDTWRYFTGISIAYSPKWIKGLSLGASRTFQVYRKDMEDGLRAWFPLFDPFPKEGVGNVENILLREDQHLGLFFRWNIPKIQFEFYGEYMRNDHALNWRDAIMNPEHSRGYVLGISKYANITGTNYIFGFEAEMTQTQNSINRLTRYLGLDRGVNIYYNGQVNHGLTHFGQILGSSLGLSGNQQDIQISLIDGINRAYVNLARIERDPHFYYLASASSEEYKKWTDFAITTGLDYQIKTFYFSPAITLVNSKNINWYYPEQAQKNFPTNKNAFNMRIDFNLIYSF
ncbi:capsule assembly Wzi family protein [Algoriphagus namhaensis]